MIDELDEALRELLIRELPIKNHEVDIAFDQPKREWSARLSRPTINLYLHDLRENTRLRREQNPFDVERRPNAVVQARQPMRIDLHYLVTAWATAPEDEHRLLARTLMTLMRFPEFPGDLLTEGLQDQPIPIPLKVAQADTLDKPSDLWSVLDNQQRPGIVLIATLAISPYPTLVKPLPSTAEVRSSLLDNPEAEHSQVSIRGTVRSRKPLAKLRARLLETGRAVDVRPNGEYGIRNLRPGDYTLEITAEGRQPSKHKLTVPSASYDVEL